MKMAGPGKFRNNDKVFAKMRGYPPWPAKVKQLVDSTSKKYQVFFYGTKETGVCKEEELYPYAEFKDKFGKGPKRRHFNEAISEIEFECLTQPQHDMKDVYTNIPKFKRRKFDAEETDNEDKTRLTESSSDSLSTGTGSHLIKLYSALPNGIVYNKLHAIRTRTPAGKLIVFDTDQFLPPDSCKSELDLERWKALKKFELKQIKRKIENGLPIDSVHAQIVEYQSMPEFQAKLEMEEKHIATQLKLEIKMFELLERLKESLQVQMAKPPDMDGSILVMDEIIKLPMNALMLKKHPEVFETCIKVTRYEGQIAQEEVFDMKAKEVRDKAKQVFNKFKTLFKIPPNQTFVDLFKREVKAFNQATKNVSAFDLYRLSYDPVFCEASLF